MSGVLPGAWAIVEGRCFKNPSSMDDVRGGLGPGRMPEAGR